MTHRHAHAHTHTQSTAWFPRLLLIAESDVIVAICILCVIILVLCICVSATILKILMLSFRGRFYPFFSFFFGAAINSHMTLFIVALQSMSYFSICHRYSLLCYRASCCGLPFVLLLQDLHCVSLCDTVWLDVAALSSRYAAKLCKTFCAALQRNKRGAYISISWLTFILHSMRPSLCSSAKERCISQ